MVGAPFDSAQGSASALIRDWPSTSLRDRASDLIRDREARGFHFLVDIHGYLRSGFLPGL